MTTMLVCVRNPAHRTLFAIQDKYDGKSGCQTSILERQLPWGETAGWHRTRAFWHGCNASSRCATRN